MTEAEEKAKLIKDALKIVDELAKLKFHDPDEFYHIEDKFDKLVRRAEIIKQNKHWRLT